MSDKPEQYEIIWTENDWRAHVNEKFIPLINCKSRYIIEWGGRGSSKSTFTAKLIVYKMLNSNKFRGLLVRNEANKVKDSNYFMVRSAIEDMGLSELFTCTENPLQIKCFNGAVLLCRGLDEPEKLKSLNANFCWYEETPPATLRSWLSISNGLRSSTELVQEIFTLNPQINMHFEDYWFFQKFFSKNPTEKDFVGVTKTKSHTGKQIDVEYTVHHSTYADNRFLTDEYKASLIALKDEDPYMYAVETEGMWANPNNEFGFYKRFNRGKNTFNNINYNPDLPLFVSFDFNVIPGMHATVWQVEGMTASCINEISTKAPENNTTGIARAILQKYNDHTGGLIIMGDASGRNRATTSEFGVNNFTILMEELQQFNPTMRVPLKNQSLVQRGNFINLIFQGEKDGIQIRISDRCVGLINDIVFTKQAPDGGKAKQSSKDGEKFGHFSDTLDYAVCEIFKVNYQKYITGKSGFYYVDGKQPINTRFKY